MNRSPLERRGESSGANEWKIELDCGHSIRVPFDSAIPFVTACIVRHEEDCPGPERPALEPIDWVVAATFLAGTTPG